MTHKAPLAQRLRAKADEIDDNVERTKQDRDDGLWDEIEHLREAADEIERLSKERAILIELVMDANLTPGAKNLVAIAIRDGSLTPTEETMAWSRKVVERLNQQSPLTEPK